MNKWDAFHLILLAAALQGVILAIALWRTKADRQAANRMLSIILLFFAYRLVVEVMRSIGIIGFDTWIYHVFLEYNWIYGALFYFYVNRYIDPSSVFMRKDLVHLIPLLVEFILSNYVKIQNFYWDGTRESLTWFGEHAYILWMHTPFQLIVFSGLILYYSILSKRLLRVYTHADRKLVQKEDVDWIQLLLNWYRWFAIAVIVSGLIDYLFFDYAFDPFYKFPVYIGMAILTYWLGLQGFSRRGTPHLLPKKQLINLSVNDERDAIVKLKNKMEKDKLYRQASLTLADLAASVDLKPYELTQLLNRSISKNFSDYVNEYRVAEAKRLINSPVYEHQTLLSIAYEAGFNSKASFNRIILI